MVQRRACNGAMYEVAQSGCADGAAWHHADGGSRPRTSSWSAHGHPRIGQGRSSGGQRVPSVISSTKHAMPEAARTQNSDNLNRNHAIIAKLTGIIGWEGQRPAQAGRGMPNSVSCSAKLPLSVWASWHFAAPLHSQVGHWVRIAKLCGRLRPVALHPACGCVLQVLSGGTVVKSR